MKCTGCWLGVAEHNISKGLSPVFNIANEGREERGAG